MRLLRIVFIVQLLALVPAFAFLLVRPVTLGTALLLFYLTPACALVVLYSIWQFIRHGSRRRLALATATTPIVCCVAPFAIHALNGGPVAPMALVAAVAVLVVIAIVVLLAGSEQWQESGRLGGKDFNRRFLIALGVLLALLWFPVAAWLAVQERVFMPDSIEVRDAIMRIAGYYFIAVALPGLGLALWALVHGPVGFVRNSALRVVHLSQIVLALALLASLAMAVMAVSIAMLNPG